MIEPKISGRQSYLTKMSENNSNNNLIIHLIVFKAITSQHFIILNVIKFKLKNTVCKFSTGPIVPGQLD